MRLKQITLDQSRQDKLGEFISKWNIAAKPKEEQDKVNVDLAASGVAFKERLSMPVVAEMAGREHPTITRNRSALHCGG